MARYRYTARTAQGKRVTEVLEAASEREAMATIASSGKILLSLEQTTARVNKANPSVGLFQRKVKLDAIVILCRQMYSLTKAGVPLLRAIKGLADSSDDPVLKGALHSVGSELSNGRPLSSAMRDHPRVFSDLFVSLIQVGENTGRLDDAMLQLAEYYEQEIETRRRIKSALRYPSFVLIVIFGAVAFLNVKVVPQFVGMFEKFGSDLPLPTKILMATSSFFVNYWWLLIISMGCSFAGWHVWKNTEQGRVSWDRFKIRLPIVGTLLNRALMSRFSRTFALMLRAGVPLNSALQMSGDALDNHFLAGEVDKMKGAIESGMNLSSVTADSKLFTPLVHQMIQVGEETGQIDTLLLEASDFYDREVDYDLKTLSARIEPILLMVVAGMVLILALGIFLPMWNMLDLMRGG
ncbi:type II secretion system F family protein [Enterovibrio sp. ZSDZ35]|uniref:Type II secretion system F family protein n=1 Tax=Enterovibrio qingdaonensis TaxID=2899818 RepID=A0ABT5QMI6_9GAMM|nr:type II secretion system F family protein [Enterovibrio sp. ZSDZ35]MDD1782202.1 type II secretion system F family protein [Enterovibrio sp. ZSDZ35]